MDTELSESGVCIEVRSTYNALRLVARTRITSVSGDVQQVVSTWDRWQRLQANSRVREDDEQSRKVVLESDGEGQKRN